jgi:hypothetical protein
MAKFEHILEIRDGCPDAPALCTLGEFIANNRIPHNRLGSSSIEFKFCGIWHFMTFKPSVHGAHKFVGELYDSYGKLLAKLYFTL